ncbi:hypothetical protein ABGB18_35355 [Nonomuraea sp. B12E4]|uniref:hypothetical protein n=1 Tax=Nonomuraea sp. B12E4 TaxID=3153564 RepID=UPI00325DDABC
MASLARAALAVAAGLALSATTPAVADASTPTTAQTWTHTTHESAAACCKIKIIGTRVGVRDLPFTNATISAPAYVIKLFHRGLVFLII